MLEDTDGMAATLLNKLQAKASEPMQNKLEAYLRQRPKAPVNSLQTGQVFITPRFSVLFNTAAKQAKRMGDSFTSPEHLLLALLEGGGTAAEVLTEQQIDEPKLLQALKDLRGKRKVDSPER
jgi:ATP-dependent Clp protease ATP-binding subunit ClpB